MIPSPSQIPSPLDVIRNTPLLRECIIQNVELSEAKALNAVRPYRARTFRGTMFYHEAIYLLGTNLVPQGYTWEDVDNQIRLLSPPDEKGMRHRLLICRGYHEGGHIRVNKKGYLTRTLINSENAAFNPTAGLFPELKPTDRVANFWIVSELLKGDGLKIYATLPGQLDESSTIFECWDYELIHTTNLNEVHIKSDDQPDGVFVPISIQEKDGTND